MAIDNSFLTDKVYLRANHLPDGDVITVLDCFAGKGHIWKNVVHLTGRKIRRLAMDYKDGLGFHLPGNNLAWMPSLDLNYFDVIDLDAYGVPYQQLKLIFDADYRGVVFVTFIQSVFGGIPHDLLVDVGVSEDMIKKCPTLFYKSGWSYFLDWLAMRGVSKIWRRSFHKKYYVCFNAAEKCVSDLGSLQARKAAGHA